MKRILIISIALLATVSLYAGVETGPDGQIIKTGYNIGPLPAIAYDADKGLQLGAVLQLFNYGDGHNYPGYNSKIYLEYSYFTKGSQLIQLRYDNKELIPGVRWSSSLRVNLDRAMDFYGFNGYGSYYDYSKILSGKDKASSDPIFTPFYKYQRNEARFKTDFLGEITDGLRWEAGLFFDYYKLGSIDYNNINKGKSDAKKYPETYPTLYDYYKKTGIISEAERDGGYAGGVRAGFVYDTRDKEGAPSRGIWADAHVIAALPGISKMPYYKYSLTWRHYVPIVSDDVLTFAYRLNYEGTFGKSIPFYALSYITNMGEKCDFEGMGGYQTVRGIVRNRVVGLDMATYTAEMRWRFVKFHIGKQNIALALNVFSDGSMVTRGVDISKLNGMTGTISPVVGQAKEVPHITFGGGFRFIMNENFIVAAEYGMPVTHLMKKSPLYNQDGTGAFYVNIGYLF